MGGSSCHWQAALPDAPSTPVGVATRRDCLRLALALAAAALAPARAAASPYRVGVIIEAATAGHPVIEGLKEGLRDLGFLEGRDIVYEVHFTRGKPEASAAAAETLARSGVDLIFTGGEAATQAAKKATQQIPVVFALVGDPVTTQLVATLPFPGGNLTGVSSRIPELAPKRLEVLKTLIPALRRVWFVYYAGDFIDYAVVGKLYEPARQLGVELLDRAVRDVEQLRRMLKEVRPGDGLFAPSGSALDLPAAVHEVALASRIPAVFHSTPWVSRGALVSYGPDLRAQGMQAARLVAKIARGASPRDLPVEGAEDIHLALNLKTAAALGLPVARKLIFRANVVYR